MIHFYADEDFPLGVVEELRKLGWDVLTALEAGRANQGIPDPQVLDYAIGLRRAVLTMNRWHFMRLHKSKSHFGIIICTNDTDIPALTQRIHSSVLAEQPLANKLLRINKPAKP